VAHLWIGNAVHADVGRHRHAHDWLPAYALIPGFVMLALLFVFWFHTVIGENQHGMYNMAVDRSFRMGMMWFIFSEVMFFAAFFGALFYARNLAVPWLSGDGVKIFTKLLLWKDYDGVWPTNGPAALGPRADGTFRDRSGARPAGHQYRHPAHQQRHGHDRAPRPAHRPPHPAEDFSGADLPAGIHLRRLQAYEYHEAYTELGLQLGTGIYGSTFFMLTGFHGMHVTVGAIMLTVIWFRVMKGHFTPQRHFGFEAVAWYWHFVDVVWLGLFIFVYWL
jgi:cytochrome c oxidase subunit 3